MTGAWPSLLVDPMPIKAGEPGGVGRVSGHMAIEFRGAVGSPGRPGFTKRELDGIDMSARRLKRAFILRLQRIADRAPRTLEIIDQRRSPVRTQPGI